VQHRTVRCASGATATSRQRSSAENIKCATVCACARRSQSRHQKAHRTVYRTCPVHHRAVRWPQLSELQRSEPNGLVTWLAHRIVFGGAPDCSRHPSIHYISFNTRAIHNTPRHKSKPPIESKSPIQLYFLGLVKTSTYVLLLLLLLGWLSSFSHSYSQSLVSEARDTNCVVVLPGSK
jgi:hypothetical protein